MMAFRQRIVARVTGPGGFDGWGTPIPGETIETTFYGALQPLSADEKFSAAGDRTIDVFKLFAPAGTTLDAKATVVVDGVEYAMQGNVEPHWMGAHVHHLEALVKRVTG